jgi:hypothetical protein
MIFDLVFIVFLGLLGSIFLLHVYLEALPDLDGCQSKWTRHLYSQRSNPTDRSLNGNQLTRNNTYFLTDQIQDIYRSIVFETSQTTSKLSKKLNEPISFFSQKAGGLKKKDHTFLSIIKDCFTPAINQQHFPNNYIRKGMRSCSFHSSLSI